MIGGVDLNKYSADLDDDDDVVVVVVVDVDAVSTLLKIG
jgi:hypothetical protein